MFVCNQSSDVSIKGERAGTGRRGPADREAPGTGHAELRGDGIAAGCVAAPIVTVPGTAMPGMFIAADT